VDEDHGRRCRTGGHAGPQKKLCYVTIGRRDHLGLGEIELGIPQIGPQACHRRVDATDLRREREPRAFRRSLPFSEHVPRGFEIAGGGIQSHLRRNVLRDEIGLAVGPRKITCSVSEPWRFPNEEKFRLADSGMPLTLV
jgi:hypothetical protein